MRKNKQTWSVKTLVFLALLVAIQLVLSRVLVIDLGVYRITLGTVATVLAGLWMGPVAGGVEGAVADIIGCFMKGYGVNPLITLSAVAWGVIPGLAGKLMAEKNRKVKTVVMCVRNCSLWRSGNTWTDHCRTGNDRSKLLCNYARTSCTVCNHDSNLLRTYQSSLFQPAYRHGCRKHKTC